MEATIKRAALAAPVLDPQSEPALYHNPARRGYATLAWATRSGRVASAQAMSRLGLPDLSKPERNFLGAQAGLAFRQHSYPLEQLPTVLDNLDRHIPLEEGDTLETTSIWLSQAEFAVPNRQKKNLRSVAVCWVDIDLQHENSPAHLRRLTPEAALEKVLEIARVKKLQTPSLVLWTGRGLAVKWLLDTPLPRAAAPRWAAVQAALVEAFAALGADASARDASRVLRLAGTWNPKSGSSCEVIFVNEFFFEIVRVAFDDLADAVLPLTRAQLEELRHKRSEATALAQARVKQRLTLLQGGRGSGNLKSFNPVLLAWAQVEDYRKLGVLRPQGSREEGWTNTLVWLASSALAIAVWADADLWGNEITGLVQELAPHWGAARVMQATAGVRSRMQAMARGKWVDFQGRMRPPVYTPSHKYILSALGVKDSEAEQLAVILPEDLARERARERDRSRKQEARREQGSLPRADYERQRLDASLERERQAVEMYHRGQPVKGISEALGLSLSRTYALIASHGQRNS